MSVIRLQEMTPQIYTEESRDFQLLSRLYDSVFNGLKFDTDSILDLIDTKECRTSVLQLLQTKLGFFTERKIDDEKLRSILECFPILVRNKGSLRAIKETLYLFLRMYSVSSNMEIYYLATPYSPPFSEEEPCVLASGKLPENNSLIIRIHSFETKPDTSVMEEIFRYILPAGINYYIEFDKGATLQDIVLKSEDSAELTFVSDNINSQLRSSDQTEPYNIGTVNTSSLISTDSYVSNRFIGYYGDEQSASDYLATLVDKIYSTAVINYSATGEVSGPIVSISDAEAGAPVEALSVAVDPIQDIHGYDNPWPAGGGVNLLPPYSSPSVTIEGVTLTNNNGEYTLNGTTGSNIALFDISVILPAGQYTVALNNPTVNSQVEIYGIDKNIAVPLQVVCSTANAAATATFSDEVKTFRIRVLRNGTVDNFKLSPVFSAGATAATKFYPYENICPITGWTSVEGWRTGEQLIDDSIKHVQGSSLLIGATNVNTYPYFLKAGTYRMTVFGISRTYGYIREENDDTHTTVITNSTTGTVTLSRDGNYRLWLYGSDAVSGNVTGLMLTLGNDVISSYHPYTGAHLTADFSAYGTQYGGWVDVVSGEVWKSWESVDLATVTSSMQYNGTRKNNVLLAILTLPKKYGEHNFLSDKFADSISADGKFTVRGRLTSPTCEFEFPYSAVGVTSESTPLEMQSAAKDWLNTNHAQFVYELATPVLLGTLTPQSLALLEGENNLWSDAGDISITYKRDGTYKAMICTAYSSNTPTWYRINFLGNLTTEEVSTQGGIVSALQAKGIIVNNGDLIKYNNLYLLRVNNDWQECNYARYILNTYHLTE